MVIKNTKKDFFIKPLPKKRGFKTKGSKQRVQNKGFKTKGLKKRKFKNKGFSPKKEFKTKGLRKEISQ
ncbi:hypothetical protein BZK17_02420 [Helicobacter pylori]|nr:hypothetical protein BZK17_02420 [Helicobacter pylori]